MNEQPEPIGVREKVLYAFLVIAGGTTLYFVDKSEKKAKKKQEADAKRAREEREMREQHATDAIGIIGACTASLPHDIQLMLIARDDPHAMMDFERFKERLDQAITTLEEISPQLSPYLRIDATVAMEIGRRLQRVYVGV